jgi:hypothetical protein
MINENVLSDIRYYDGQIFVGCQSEKYRFRLNIIDENTACLFSVASKTYKRDTYERTVYHKNPDYVTEQELQDGCGKESIRYYRPVFTSCPLDDIFLITHSKYAFLIGQTCKLKLISNNRLALYSNEDNPVIIMEIEYDNSGYANLVNQMVINNTDIRLVLWPREDNTKFENITKDSLFLITEAKRDSHAELIGKVCYFRITRRINTMCVIQDVHIELMCEDLVLHHSDITKITTLPITDDTINNHISTMVNDVIQKLGLKLELFSPQLKIFSSENNVVKVNLVPTYKFRQGQTLVVIYDNKIEVLKLKFDMKLAVVHLVFPRITNHHNYDNYIGEEVTRKYNACICIKHKIIWCKQDNDAPDGFDPYYITSQDIQNAFNCYHNNNIPITIYVLENGLLQKIN